MSQLRDAQAAFFAGLTPDATFDAQKAAAHGLRGSEAFEAAQRLNVYRNMYVIRLTEALRMDFVQVHKILNQALFAKIALKYIVAHPPKTPSLDGFGMHFAAFLALQSALRADVSDLARLEWSRTQASHHALKPAASYQDWLDLGFEKAASARFVFSQSLAVLETQHDACALWHALEYDKALPAPIMQKSSTVVWRDGAQIAHKPLTSQDASALKTLLGGGDFTQLCALFVDDAQPAQRVAQRMQQFFAAGFIASVEHS